MTWANRHARAGFVLAYCALQPLTAMVVSFLIITAGGDQFGLKEPGINALGSIGIIVGLLCTLRDGKQQHELDSAKDGGAADEPATQPAKPTTSSTCATSPSNAEARDGEQLT